MTPTRIKLYLTTAIAAFSTKKPIMKPPKQPILTLTIFAVPAIALCLGLTSCRKGKEAEARELLAQALLFETTGNPKAQVLFTRVVMDFPDTQAAVEAKHRMDVRRQLIMDNDARRSTWR